MTITPHSTTTHRIGTQVLFVGLVITASMWFISSTPVGVVAAATTSKAASASASPTTKLTSETATSSTTQKLKERIERIVEEKKEQVKGVLSEITENRRGFIGQITRISDEAITIKSNKASHILPLSDKVELSKKNTELKVADVEVGQWALVIGNDEQDTFNPEKIIVSDTSLRPDPRIITLGSIKKISKTEITIVPRGKTEEVTFVIGKKSQFQDLDGATITAGVLSEELQAIVIAIDSDSNKTISTLRALTPSTALSAPTASPKAKTSR